MRTTLACVAALLLAGCEQSGRFQAVAAGPERVWVVDTANGRVSVCNVGAMIVCSRGPDAFGGAK